MKKDDVAMLPPGANVMRIGLGWSSRSDIDFDASVVGIDANKNKT
jgi:stress response protein SCP2